MVEISIEYLGQLRSQATHGPSGTQLVTDAPTDNMGRGESFSPTDLVATGLGTCMLTIMGIVAQRDGIDLSGTRVKVVKEMTTTPPRRIARLTVEFHVPATPSDADHKKLENAARTCPVHKSLHPEIETPITFHFGSKG